MQVTLLADTRWGLSTILYLACSHLPFVFMFLNMLGKYPVRIAFVVTLLIM